MRRKLVAGNWKMNGSRASIKQLLNGILDQNTESGCEIAVFPPVVFLPMVQEMLLSTRIGLGAQNIDSHVQGAFTGEVSASMVAEFGCTYVLIGHSERRAYYAETDDIVSEKFSACVASGLRPVLCVGETLEQRQKGLTEEIVKHQLQMVLDNCGIGTFAEAIIAYEPVWAIGTGMSASPRQAEEVHALIRDVMMQEDSGIGQQIRLLYGGSVSPESASKLFAEENIDGALVGGASLNAADFLKISQLAGH
ncbi:MAG: triose-phosphate isomerase [Gammaproteobacteria bacterium]|nr:triose-phosphate isomerase [Gammaproteobacteria bacterium]